MSQGMTAVVTHQDQMPSCIGQISPASVRYIKLGEGGSWEKEAREKGIILFGFGSGTTEERFALCRNNDWQSLTESFIDEGKNARDSNAVYQRDEDIF